MNIRVEIPVKQAFGSDGNVVRYTKMEVQSTPPSMYPTVKLVFQDGLTVELEASQLTTAVNRASLRT